MIALSVLTIVECLLLLITVLAAATVALIYMAIQQFSHTTVRPAPDEPPQPFRDIIAGTNAWAQANGFEFLGHYEADNVRIAAWRHMTRPTFLCQYITDTTQAHDFATQFAGNISLTTGSTSHAHLLPRPMMRYAQAFPDESLDERWQRHRDMEAYLVQQGGAQPGQISRPLEDIMNEALQEQLAYVRSLTGWPVRAAWWYFVRRNRWRNLSIIDQRQLGWIHLPNELTGASDSPVRA